MVGLSLFSCPICFSIENISVDYYGKNHVCVKCRKLIRDDHGNQIRIFLNETGEIVCLGIKVKDRSEENKRCRLYSKMVAKKIIKRYTIIPIIPSFTLMENLHLPLLLSLTRWCLF